jgi:hypothetical protein
MPLSPGDTLRMPVHTERRVWPLSVEVVRREELDIPGFGKLTTLRLEPTMHFPGIFVRKSRMVVWVDEDTRIPVRMNVDIPIGSITVTLVDTEKAPLVRLDAKAAAGKSPKTEAPKTKASKTETPKTESAKATKTPAKLPQTPKTPAAPKPLDTE